MVYRKQIGKKNRPKIDRQQGSEEEYRMRSILKIHPMVRGTETEDYRKKHLSSVDWVTNQCPASQRDRGEGSVCECGLVLDLEHLTVELT